MAALTALAALAALTLELTRLNAGWRRTALEARSRLSATRGGTGARLSALPAKLTGLTSLTAAGCSSSLRGGSRLRLRLHGVRHDAFASLQAGDDLDQQSVTEACLYDASARRSVGGGHEYHAAPQGSLHGSLGNDDHVACLGDQDLDVRGQAGSQMLVGRVQRDVDREGDKPLIDHALNRNPGHLALVLAIVQGRKGQVGRLTNLQHPNVILVNVYSNAQAVGHTHRDEGGGDPFTNIGVQRENDAGCGE